MCISFTQAHFLDRHTILKESININKYNEEEAVKE